VNVPTSHEGWTGSGPAHIWTALSSPDASRGDEPTLGHACERLDGGPVTTDGGPVTTDGGPVTTDDGLKWARSDDLCNSREMLPSWSSRWPKINRVDGRVKPCPANPGNQLLALFLLDLMGIDDLLGDVRRHFLVLRQLGAEGAAATGDRAQLGGIRDQLSLRYMR